MRVARCGVAATALLSAAHHAEASERTAATGLVAAAGNDAGAQQPLMPAGPEDEHGDDLLRSLLDITQLDLGPTAPDADPQDFKSCAACEVRLLPYNGLAFPLLPAGPARAAFTVMETYRRCLLLLDPAGWTESRRYGRR